MNKNERHHCITIAQTWRDSTHEPKRNSGVVLVFEGVVYGWKDRLRDPHHERPGAVAIDADNHVYLAEGGDDQYGAKAWVVV